MTQKKERDKQKNLRELNNFVLIREPFPKICANFVGLSPHND